jgi:ferrous iron transport protein B
VTPGTIKTDSAAESIDRADGSDTTPASSGDAGRAAGAPGGRTIVLVGNPNVGKTSLFNRLAGRRQKTANFPGTTQEAHVATVSVNGQDTALIDLPGAYSLWLDGPESTLCRGALEGSAAPQGRRAAPPDAVVLVLDATNLPRNLRLAGEVLGRGLPAVAVLTMTDEARRRGMSVDLEVMAHRLGVPVLAISNRTGEGVEDVPALIATAHPTTAVIPSVTHQAGERSDPSELEAWGDSVYADAAADRSGHADDSLTDRLDRAFTHPVLGVASFAMVMTGLFWAIYRFATIPMDWIDAGFGSLGVWLANALPEGAVSALLVDGVVAGVGGTVIFLPQIVLLFFLIALLEQSGYLARAAFVIDRVLRPFGLPGHAFVPLLSGHACAIPAIMSARGIPDVRQRLATILVIPFMSCSARIPVYVLLTGLLFPASPAMQALAFTGCYVLGIVAALGTAVLFRSTIMRGKSRAMALELPRYRLPSLLDAGRMALHRGWLFLKKAGTVILGISVVLWWLGTYPQSEPSLEADALRAQAAVVGPVADATETTALLEADRLDTMHASRSSFLGRIGTTIEPVFAPIGADRQLTVGILASFAAREVFVSTIAVQTAGQDDPEGDGVLDSIANATRDDGTPLFTPATSWSMLVFFVLAIQCLPTLVVTAREAGGWKWAGVQFAWMTSVAYAAAWVAYTAAVALGGGG